MRSFGSVVWTLAAIAGVTIVAAGAKPSSAGVVVSPAVRTVVPAYRVPQDPYLIYDACTSKGGVSASPCPVVLTMSNPAQQVTITAPSGSTVTEKDNCTNGTKTIATVTGSGTNYVVSSGNTKGHCKAIFTAKSSTGKRIGHAGLPITNKFAVP